MYRLLAIGILTTALVASAAGSALSHDSFLAKRFGAWTLVNGHWGAGDDAYEASRIGNVAAHDASGEKADISVLNRTGFVALDAGEGASVIAASYISGFWTKDADDTWHNQPKSEIENPRLAGEYERHTIAVIASAETFRPFGLPLEIVPMSDPLVLEPGDELMVQVLANGEPLADVALGSLIPGIEAVTTDADGMATWVIQQGDNILLAAQSTTPHPEPEKADSLNHKATLSFMIADVH